MPSMKFTSHRSNFRYMVDLGGKTFRVNNNLADVVKWIKRTLRRGQVADLYRVTGDAMWLHSVYKCYEDGIEVSRP